MADTALLSIQAPTASPTCVLPRSAHAYVALSAPPSAVDALTAGLEVSAGRVFLPIVDLGEAETLSVHELMSVLDAVNSVCASGHSAVPVQTDPAVAVSGRIRAQGRSADLTSVRTMIGDALLMRGVLGAQPVRAREMALVITDPRTGELSSVGGTFDYTSIAVVAPGNPETVIYERTIGGQPTAALTAAGVASDEGTRFVIPILLPEGVKTGDKRRFAPLSVRTRDLPLPLMWQKQTGDGHSGSVIVGRIDSIERIRNGLGNARGILDTSPDAREAERLIRGRFLRGISADLDEFEGESHDGEDSPTISDEEIMGIGKKSGKGKDKDKGTNKDSADRPGKRIASPRIAVTAARIMGATLVAMPAFQEATIVLDPEPDEIDEQEDALMRITDGVYAEQDDTALVAAAAIAASIPTEPPSDWFTNPGLNKPTALTVTDEGRVYGHIAAWDVDHIGLPFGTRPPRSASNYGYFHTGVIRTDIGSDIPVGQLTLAGGHAPLHATAALAVKHYDDTASAFADVHAGEDAYGIWVAGALRPGTTPEQVRAIRASAPSGDWRPIGGRLELVAVCQVNVPGFPIARAQVASGHVTALVAAGTAPLIALIKQDQLGAYEGELTARVARLEDALGGHAGHSIAASAATVTAVDDASLIRARTARARAESALHLFEHETGTALVASGSPQSVDLDSPRRVGLAVNAYAAVSPEHQAGFRRQVRRSARNLGRPDLVPHEWNTADSVREEYNHTRSLTAGAVATVDFSETEQQAMIASGACMPDGSFPIPDVDHLKRAIRSFGRANPARRAAVKRHIIRRARSLQRMDLVPEKWAHTAGIRASAELRLSDPDVELVQDGLVAAVAFSKRSHDREWDERLHPRHDYGQDRGKFRDVLARLRDDLGEEAGTAEAVTALDEAAEAEGVGDLAAAKAAAEHAVELVDDVASHTVQPELRANFQQAGKNLGAAISNLGLPQGDDAAKFRYSDLPEVLQNLIQDLMSRLKATASPEVYRDNAGDLETYISGIDLMTLDDIHSNLAGILAILV